MEMVFGWIEQMKITTLDLSHLEGKKKRFS